MATKITLKPGMFAEHEQTLVEHGSLSASTFRFSTGVCGLRIRNAKGELVLLPFQGQQIWSVSFLGRNLTMKSMFDEPRATRDYLGTYGAFLLHCGASSMGVPTDEDNHPLHGELPNAPYSEAYLLTGEDDLGRYITLSGRYQETVAFSTNYVAEPRTTLHEDASLFGVSMTVTNLKQTPMELMYMAHVNFRPVDNSRLVYSAPCTPETVSLRASIPSHVTPGPGYLEFLDELAENPAKHNVLSPELSFDPEVVFYINYETDGEGWAHSMQVHPDGAADYIRYRPDQLDHGVRWICRTPDQDALGLILPSTAEPEGYTAEKAKGNIKTLAAGDQWRCDMVIGALPEARVAEMEATIEEILGE